MQEQTQPTQGQFSQAGEGYGSQQGEQYAGQQGPQTQGYGQAASQGTAQQPPGMQPLQQAGQVPGAHPQGSQGQPGHSRGSQFQSEQSPGGQFQSEQMQGSQFQTDRSHGGQARGGQGGGMGQALHDVETPEQRGAVEAISQAIQVCGWCADQCIQLGEPGMSECIRLCEDVTELGETALALLPRSSRYAQQVIQAFEQAAQACAQECGQHQHAHCQECAQVLPQATRSVQQLRGSWRHQQSGV